MKKAEDRITRTKKQREMISYLKENGPMSGEALAEGLGSTTRGVGLMFSRLLWESTPGECPVSRRMADGIFGGYVYSAN